MQAEWERRSVGSQSLVSESNGFVSISVPSTSASSPAYIEHRVSRMDTLAGVAIKYGVEVADIKRMNGLVSDLQMFAHKSLQIPLPGRHPPSPVLSNGSASDGEQTSLRNHKDALDSFQSLKLKPPPKQKVTAAMTNLQGYYNLTPSRKGPLAEGTEMAIYKTDRVLFSEYESLPKQSPASDPLLNHHRRTRSFANGFLPKDDNAVVIDVGESSESERANSEKFVRRRQKSDADPFSRVPGSLIEDSSGGFSGRTGKGLALRPKAGSRTDNDISRAAASNSAGDSSMANGFLFVRKSSSTSNLQESDNGSSVWPPWNLKPELISRPIFDGLPKPVNVRRNKAAVD
ncbi:hypothetical protein J5N97_022942 [Dioscorea zingiberensis]|uniref:LysM domain-containing protein n=1 Tax=Dioscorea zingiberensis TaxID=325984 RepID=A0A9D5HBD7_9LILI|nr:hypothetical protein J5N97_022942 [Dioscorea zingiberensis]